MKYTDDYGNVVTGEQLDDMALAIERGDFSDFVGEADVIYGMIEPNKVEKSTVCVQFPVAMKTQLTQIAKLHSCSMSDLIRAYTYDGIKKENLQAL